MARIEIHALRLREASRAERDTGLLGYLSFTINGMLRIDGVTLRRAGDEMAISFPARRDRQGRDHPLVFPINDRTRLEIERQVLDCLGDDLAGER